MQPYTRALTSQATGRMRAQRTLTLTVSMPLGFSEYRETRFRKCIPKEQHTKRLKQNTVPNTPTAKVSQAEDIMAFLGQEFALKVDKRLRPLSQHHSLPYGQIFSTKNFGKIADRVEQSSVSGHRFLFFEGATPQISGYGSGRGKNCKPVET